MEELLCYFPIIRFKNPNSLILEKGGDKLDKPQI